MYKIFFTSLAETDLQSIFNYIAEDNRERAISYLGEIEGSINKLKDYPGIGHRAKYIELSAQGIRVLPHDNYLIFYIVNENAQAVNIIRVLHGSVNYKKLF